MLGFIQNSGAPFDIGSKGIKPNLAADERIATLAHYLDEVFVCHCGVIRSKDGLCI